MPGRPRRVDRPRSLCAHGPIVGYAPPRPATAAAPAPRGRRAGRSDTAVACPSATATGEHTPLEFSELGLSAALLRTVDEEGYTEPTPVQERAIPLILEGRDVLAAAQTGTGKTAAFTLPILDRLGAHANTSFSPARHPVRCLVLTPTRELAVQVADAVKTYGRYVPLRAAVVYGGVPLDPRSRSCAPASRSWSPRPAGCSTSSASAPPTSARSRSSCSTRATACSTWASCRTSGGSSTCCDAASRRCCSRRRSRDDIKRLAGSILNDPVTIEVSRHGTAAENVRQLVYPVDRDRKEELLAHLIVEGDWRQVLVFTRTKLAASRLASWLDRHGVAATAIHSDRAQSDRDEGARGVQGGRDPGARGDRRRRPRPRHRGPAHVVNFELPVEPRGLRPPHRPHRPSRRDAATPSASCASTRQTSCAACSGCARHAIPWTVEEGVVPRRDAEPQAPAAPRGAGGSGALAAQRPGPPARTGRRSGVA